jgi:hypothetical protein
MKIETQKAAEAYCLHHRSQCQQPLTSIIRFSLRHLGSNGSPPSLPGNNERNAWKKDTGLGRHGLVGWSGAAQQLTGSGPSQAAASCPPPTSACLPFVHSYTADAAVQEDLRRADQR